MDKDILNEYGGNVPFFVFAIMWALENKITVPKVFTTNLTDFFTPEFLELYRKWFDETVTPE